MKYRFIPAFVIVATLALPATAADWPTYRHDGARSGIASEALAPPLYAHWVYRPHHGPRPAWPAPAVTDYYHELFNLTPAVTYDRAFHVCVADGTLYFGSSADDTVYALDAATGETRWAFHTQGPVRLAPAWADGRVYFGSDDGRAYCLDGKTGELIWTWQPSLPLRLIPGNGRLISDHPVRSGVLVRDGLAYVCSGIFPTQTVYICALDAATGETAWIVESDAVSAQGYLLASQSYLFVPTGRTAPAVFERATGRFLGAIEGNGGSFALLTDEYLLSGPGRRDKAAMAAAPAESRESIASFPGTGLVVSGPMAYLQSTDGLMALDRQRHVVASMERDKLNEELEPLVDAYKAERRTADAARLQSLQDSIKAIEARLAEIPAGPEECAAWQTKCATPYAMVLAGDTLYAGGDGIVVGVDAATGEQVWQGDVSGSAYGLAVADGRLYVSTDSGAIHCFGQAKAESAVVLAQHVEPLARAGGRDEAHSAAQAFVNATGIDSGYAVVVGEADMAIAHGLIELTDLHFAFVTPSMRETFAACGLLGDRVTILSEHGASTLPFTTGFANLVIAYPSNGVVTVPASEAMRVVRPLGGMVVTEQHDWLRSAGSETKPLSGDWHAWVRGPVPGAGEWTQLYADAGHTACSNDAVEGPWAVQWFGEPGPRPMIDRHHRPMSSLFKDGRLFITGDNQVLTVDAYNGSPLWQLEVPESRRIGALKNAGHELVVGDTLYVLTGNDCWNVDVATGERRGTLGAPAMLDAPQEWGYLNICGDLLIGTAQFEGASFSENSVLTCDLLEGDFRPVVVSRGVFAVDRASGAETWRHARGVYMNAAMTLAGNRLCFVESNSPKALENISGQMRIDHFLEGDVALVAVDAKSGAVAWERSVEYPFQHILFLNATSDTLLVSGTYNEDISGEMQVFYRLLAYRVEDGEPVWEQTFRATNIRGDDFTDPDGTHGENWQHPVILNGTVYARPYAFDLATGEKREYMLYRGGHGCGGLTASAKYLYGRGDNPRAYPVDVAQTEGIQLTRSSRPGCWLNIIPAGGLVLIPESSSGCTCAYSIQTSIALAPRAWAYPEDVKLAEREGR